MLPRNHPPTHPGEMLLLEFLDPMDISQAYFSKHLRWLYARLNEIINGKRGMTAETAILLSRVLKTTPEFWLNLQAAYDLYEAKIYLDHAA